MPLPSVKAAVTVAELEPILTAIAPVDVLTILTCLAADTMSTA
jgi:hypothetical protein